jgi:hypothetical protein
MQIELKVSPGMGASHDKAENRKVRVPFELREIFGLECGQHITFRTADDGLITLRVDYCYKEDLAADDQVGYVTASTMGRIDPSYKNVTVGEVEMVGGITLGCDPEFFIVHDTLGTIVKANHFFDKWGQVGCDGLMAELRPLPSTDEHTVTRNLALLLKQAVTRVKSTDIGHNMKLIAASCFKGTMAGFHLHFGIPKALIGKDITIHRATTQFIKALDYYVAVPAMLIEGETDYGRRCGLHLDYGKPGNYRLDNNITLEYRVPGGALLKHPVLANGLLGLGIAVVEDVVSRLKVCTDSFVNLGTVVCEEDLRQLYPNVPSVTDLQRIIMSPSTTEARQHLGRIMADVRTMVSYNARKASIEPFFECILNNAQISSDIEQNWRHLYA